MLLVSILKERDREIVDFVLSSCAQWMFSVRSVKVTDRD